MKKFTVTLLMTAFVLFVRGQIVVTNSNIAPVGSTIVLANDSLPDSSIVPGDAGANKIWDFSALHEFYYDTLLSVAPAGTPFCDSFPDANYVLESINSSDTLFGYFIKNDDAMTSLGYAGAFSDTGSAMVISLVPYETVMDFPIQYGNHFDETFYYQIVVAGPSPGPDSIKFKHTVTKSVDVDAWGTVSIPGGTYDALRSKIIRNEADSTWILLFGTWNLVAADTSTNVSYEWYTNGVTPGFTLVSMDIVQTKANEVNSVSFLKGTPVGIRQQKTRNVKTYPNPAYNNVLFETGTRIDGKLIVYNGLGTKIIERDISGKKFNIDISNLQPGNYFINIIDNLNKGFKYSGKFIKN
jgi:hypothetical protein